MANTNDTRMPSFRAIRSAVLGARLRPAGFPMDALLAELDTGYQVLLDKDNLTDTLRVPTATAYLPTRPTDTEFQTLIYDFLSDPPYVAECLWRDELLPAKWRLDYEKTRRSHSLFSLCASAPPRLNPSVI
jgi:Streptomycin adenylyltransferase